MGYFSSLKNFKDTLYSVLSGLIFIEHADEADSTFCSFDDNRTMPYICIKEITNLEKTYGNRLLFKII